MSGMAKGGRSLESTAKAAPLGFIDCFSRICEILEDCRLYVSMAPRMGDCLKMARHFA